MGITSAWSSPYIPYLLSNSSSIPTTNTEASWCALAPTVGSLIGSFFATTLVDRVGRKKLLLLFAPITFSCLVGIAFAKHIWYITALRLIIGTTDSLAFTVLPMYIGEIVDPEIRESMSSAPYYILIVGTLLINCTGPFLDIFTSSLMASCFPAIHFFIFLLMPESPYHYVKIGKYKEAENSLKVLSGFKDVSEKLNNLKNFIQLEDEKTIKPKLTDLFSIASNRKACLICFILLFVNRSSGKAPLVIYTKTIFEESGSTIDANVSTIIFNAVELIVVVFVTIFIANKFGKRPLMIISASGCSFSIFALGTYFCLKHFECSIINYLNWLPITSLVIYNITFSLGIGFGHMIYLSELFPMNVKANATCSVQFLIISFGLVGTVFFQITSENFGIYVPFLCFAITCGIGAIFLYKIVPETKGKTLEEIQKLLR